MQSRSINHQVLNLEDANAALSGRAPPGRGGNKKVIYTGQGLAALSGVIYRPWCQLLGEWPVDPRGHLLWSGVPSPRLHNRLRGCSHHDGLVRSPVAFLDIDCN